MVSFFKTMALDEISWEMNSMSHLGIFSGGMLRARRKQDWLDKEGGL